MKLTTAQLEWLRHASACEREQGFVQSPVASLTRLEQLGLVERNPATLGKRTHWRITAKGQRVKLGQQHG